MFVCERERDRIRKSPLVASMNLNLSTKMHPGVCVQKTNAYWCVCLRRGKVWMREWIFASIG